jgi:hypothetical protein
MARHRVSVTFSLLARQVELLDRLAERTNVPKSVYVREGVDLILKRYREILHGPTRAKASESENRKPEGREREGPLPAPRRGGR